jgi:ATP-dependent Clp protease ATP-binding subunit ClpA
MGFIDQQKPYQEKLQAAINEHFSSEFLNRVDRIVFFGPLSEEALLAIFDKLLARVQERFAAQNIKLSVTGEFKREFCRRHADKARGARPLERAIEDEIVAPLTDKLLAGEIKPGMQVVWGRMEPDEARNRATLSPLLDALRSKLREQGIEITVAEAAFELLCSPYWVKARSGQDTTSAFARLVEEPLIARVQAGEFKAGDRVEVYRNLSAEIDFRKQTEDKS